MAAGRPRQTGGVVGVALGCLKNVRRRVQQSASGIGGPAYGGGEDNQRRAVVLQEVGHAQIAVHVRRVHTTKEADEGFHQLDRNTLAQ